MKPFIETLIPEAKLINRGKVKPVHCCRCGEETHPKDLVWAAEPDMAYDVCRNCYADLVMVDMSRPDYKPLLGLKLPQKVPVPYLELSVANFGPGLLVVTAAPIRTRSAFWSWLKNEVSIEFPPAEGLGAELEKGQRHKVGLPPWDECILDKKPLAVGIRDSFGRIRWAPKKDLKRVQREYAAGPPHESP